MASGASAVISRDFYRTPSIASALQPATVSAQERQDRERRFAEWFHCWDLDGNGFLDFAELQQLLLSMEEFSQRAERKVIARLGSALKAQGEPCNLSLQDFVQLMVELSRGMDGADFDRFLGTVATKMEQNSRALPGFLRKKAVWELFTSWDFNRNGFIDVSEVNAVICGKATTHKHLRKASIALKHHLLHEDTKDGALKLADFQRFIESTIGNVSDEQFFAEIDRLRGEVENFLATKGGEDSIHVEAPSPEPQDNRASSHATATVPESPLMLAGFTFGWPASPAPNGLVDAPAARDTASNRSVSFMDAGEPKPAASPIPDSTNSPARSASLGDVFWQDSSDQSEQNWSESYPEFHSVFSRLSSGADRLDLFALKQAVEAIAELEPKRKIVRRLLVKLSAALSGIGKPGVVERPEFVKLMGSILPLLPTPASVAQALQQLELQYHAVDNEDISKKKKEVVQRLFQRWDLDGNGSIDPDEFKELDQVIRASPSFRASKVMRKQSSRWTHIVSDRARDGNAQLSFAEFQNFMSDLLGGLSDHDYYHTVAQFHAELDSKEQHKQMILDALGEHKQREHDNEEKETHLRNTRRRNLAHETFARLPNVQQGTLPFFEVKQVLEQLPVLAAKKKQVQKILTKFSAALTNISRSNELNETDFSELIVQLSATFTEEQYTEFLQATEEQLNQLSGGTIDNKKDLAVRRLFQRWDWDSSGTIDAEEFDELDSVIKSSPIFKSNKVLRKQSSRWNHRLTELARESGSKKLTLAQFTGFIYDLLKGMDGEDFYTAIMQFHAELDKQEVQKQSVVEALQFQTLSHGNIRARASQIAVLDAAKRTPEEAHNPEPKTPEAQKMTAPNRAFAPQAEPSPVRPLSRDIATETESHQVERPSPVARLQTPPGPSGQSKLAPHKSEEPAQLPVVFPPKMRYALPLTAAVSVSPPQVPSEQVLRSKLQQAHFELQAKDKLVADLRAQLELVRTGSRQPTPPTGPKGPHSPRSPEKLGAAPPFLQRTQQKRNTEPKRTLTPPQPFASMATAAPATSFLGSPLFGRPDQTERSLEREEAQEAVKQAALVLQMQRIEEQAWLQEQKRLADDRTYYRSVLPTLPPIPLVDEAARHTPRGSTNAETYSKRAHTTGYQERTRPGKAPPPTVRPWRLVPRPPPTKHVQYTAAADLIDNTPEAFIIRLLCSGALLTEATLTEAFCRLDVDSNGWLAKAECQRLVLALEGFFGHAVPDAEIKELLRGFSELGDTRLSPNEFAILLLQLARR